MQAHFPKQQLVVKPTHTAVDQGRIFGEWLMVILLFCTAHSVHNIVTSMVAANFTGRLKRGYSDFDNSTQLKRCFS